MIVKGKMENGLFVAEEDTSSRSARRSSRKRTRNRRDGLVTGFGRAILVLGLLVSVYAVAAALRGRRADSWSGSPPRGAPSTRWPRC